MKLLRPESLSQAAVHSPTPRGQVEARNISKYQHVRCWVCEWCRCAQASTRKIANSDRLSTLLVLHCTSIPSPTYTTHQARVSEPQHFAIRTRTGNHTIQPQAKTTLPAECAKTKKRRTPMQQCTPTQLDVKSHYPCPQPHHTTI